MKGLGGTCNSDVCAVLSAIHVKSSKKMNATKNRTEPIRTFKLKYKERRLGEPFYYELSNAIKKKGQVRTLLGRSSAEANNNQNGSWTL